ncbi:DUF3263 domain-containing protein [Rhodococcus sp. DMU1]|uniref:DUF3263 domain-containing protein n=1 Tax=Rhodococcus sp. DMU1 TaxID=2722825 RepID=UPI00143E5DE9|nr:DUF3263 domain-containing protein [Rhodococcus sp. DMU1]QIX52636.1 DUF3263 domain-containing protein [Rhodococcus sp. DMU1]
MDIENEMLAFATKWRHWGGGPDEDIFVRFGITSQQFFHRLREILTAGPRFGLEPQLVRTLLDICDSRTRATELRAS